MGDLSRPKRILCINCNICVNSNAAHRRYRALEFDARVTTLLCQWAYPQIITQDDYICEACRDLAMASVNDNNLLNDGQQAGPSHRGHTHVCISCGRSIKRRPSDKIFRDNPTDLQQSMINIIQSRVVPRQIKESDRVCRPCWLQVRREALKMNLHDLNRSQLDPPEECQEDIQPLESIQSALKMNLRDLNRSQLDPPEECQEDVQPSGSIQSALKMNLRDLNRSKLDPHLDSNHQKNVPIVLTNYRRAPSTARHCVFPGCTANKLHCVSDKLCAIILSNHHYYLPKLARVCDKHLVSKTWDTLFDSENSMKTFNAEQIQHIFSFVTTLSPTLDFDNIQEMEDRIFEYFTGWTKESFNHFLEEVPRIREMHRGKLGLAMLLLKMRTGHSDEKVSTLVQVPRRTLGTLMDKVRNILLQDVMPENIGFMNL